MKNTKSRDPFPLASGPIHTINHPKSTIKIAKRMFGTTIERIESSLMDVLDCVSLLLKKS